MKCNGQSVVTIKTIHGRFEFPNQRFASRSGQKGFSWLEHTGQFGDGYESERLRSRCCYYANRMSYSGVSTLLKDEAGELLLSDQRIQAIVYEEAKRLSIARASETKAVVASGKTLPSIEEPSRNKRKILIAGNYAKIARVPKVSTNPLLGNLATEQFLLWPKFIYIMYEQQFTRIQ